MTPLTGLLHLGPLTSAQLSSGPLSRFAAATACPGRLQRATHRSSASRYPYPSSKGGVLAKPRSKGLIGSRPVGEALVHGATEPGKLIARS